MKFILDIETTTNLNDKEKFDYINNRVTCITLFNVENEFPISFYGEDETKILNQFWIAIGSSDEIITYCGDTFDIPFLVKRSLINNVKVSNNFKKIKFIDLYKVTNSFFICYDKYLGGKLRDWAKIFNINIETENGSKMGEYYNNKDWKSIKSHCEEDVKITKLLYIRCKNCGLLL